nr:fatty acid hydroxylase vlma [Quercus suber]
MATATSTTTTDGPALSAVVPPRNPKDSMKSTWRTGDRKQWTRHHWMLELLGIQPDENNKNMPRHAKTDKMSYLPHWESHVWVCVHALWPVLLHQAYVMYTGKNLGYIAVFVMYTLAFKLNAIHELRMLRMLTNEHGCLDGDKHSRDQIPDHSVANVMHGLFTTSTGRPMMTVFIAYRMSQTPASSYWYLWAPIEVGVYPIILDLWFYWYHRCMHDFDSLWKYHRTHHLTKHPNPLLTLYADHEQEFFDIFVIPLLTWATMKVIGFPMGFYDWWLCHQYVVFTELFGHSGVRLFVTPPTTATPLLKFFDAELLTEDHDLHHRKGWKKSHNYGKQTRLWDRLFGTCHERYETTPANIDYNSPAHLRWGLQPFPSAAYRQNRPDLSVSRDIKPDSTELVSGEIGVLEAPNSTALWAPDLIPSSAGVLLPASIDGPTTPWIPCTPPAQGRDEAENKRMHGRRQDDQADSRKRTG